MAKLTELRAARGDSWGVINQEMEKVWRAIEVALDEAGDERRTRADNVAAKTEPAVVPVALVPPIAQLPAPEAKPA